MKIFKEINKKRQEGGFSLVEMAIVLVIIGLIVSAIGVGNSTMRKAEANKVVHQFLIPFMAQAVNDNTDINSSYTVGDVTISAGSTAVSTAGTVVVIATSTGTGEALTAGFAAIEAVMMPATCASPACTKTLNVAKLSSTSPM
ncbi:MAG: prepilin-type N-terminal cleavage/methylation domain-containing protein [Magnetococcales bacterium]|nr:prepilin-type N-terminal cleavage/methylation domain-containing protein [Magnetococcales bacterium]